MPPPPTAIERVETMQQQTIEALKAAASVIGADVETRRVFSIEVKELRDHGQNMRTLLE